MKNQLLLTGGTGMVGSYVMAECLRDGQELVVLARGKGKQSASQRVEQILKRFEESWIVRLPRPRVFESDLNQTDLGLAEDDRDWIRRHCDTILHSAASLSFAPASESADNEPYRTNVDGTDRVLRLCDDLGIRKFHHVSTAYVCGKRTGKVLESEGDVGQAFANDYERSKTIAEARLRTARAEGRLDSLTVYRPSIVIDRTGLSPISGDRTIYGAFSMYQMLASRFGLPENGQWFGNLGFSGEERKNIVDVDWIAKAVRIILTSSKYHDGTYHLTTESGTSVADLDEAFHLATEAWLKRPSRVQRKPSSTASVPGIINPADQAELDRMAAPFVQTFLPYFRDDPTFARDQIDRVVAESALEPTPKIAVNELLEMVRHWSAFVPENLKGAKTSRGATTKVVRERVTHEPAEDPDEVVVCGYEVRLPGGVENADDFERMLWEGRSGIGSMPADRLDRSLYYDSTQGIPGKTYTQLGGCVSAFPRKPEWELEIESRGHFDLTHRQFAQVAMSAVESAFGHHRIDEVPGVDALRAGVLVGHSGGTELGGPLAMATLAESAAESIEDTDVTTSLDADQVRRCKKELVDSIRRDRPVWQSDGSPHFNAYSVASLTGSLTGFRGRREVIDAACSSSLLALHHAVTAIKADRMDIALVGGATFNNVDNLALFSQSGACSAEGCYPFDRRASGLISSEGYVAVVLVRRGVAEQLGLPIHGVIAGVGVASDGKGKGLWAPRSEGQQLAIRRVNRDDASRAVLDVDYLECHATSTQVGDATELDSLTALLRPNLDSPVDRGSRLMIGSAKSNLGHLLEAAGMVGLVKCLISIRKGELPPSIHFEQPNDTYDWTNSPVEVVDSVRPWPQRNSVGGRVAGVNAFGIGGLNAHAIVRQSGSQVNSDSTAIVRFSRVENRSSSPRPSAPEAIAIVGRGVVLPGAPDMTAFARLLRSRESFLSDPPTGRWPTSRRTGRWIGVDAGDRCESVPHCRGGYIRDFRFDAQGYRIPPKTIQFANPAQLMLIQATAEALIEAGISNEPVRGQWSIDRERVGVVIGTIFGGEFSNALQVGLRLPELKRHVVATIEKFGLSAVQTAEFAEQFHAAVMQRYPALLDETGGFTASTLASRIARTFDLMGGACAVDADEASGGLAIMTSIEQLRDGHIDAALCGMSHRSLDLVAFEQLYRKGQLVDSGKTEDVPNDGSRIFPGEGVAIMMLQRLSDAIAQDRKIFGVIQGDSESWVNDVQRARRDDATRSNTESSISATQLISQIGHLGGGQGIVRTIAATIAHEQNRSLDTQPTISETAQDGFQISYQVSPPPMPISTNPSLPKSVAGVTSGGIAAESVQASLAAAHEVAVTKNATSISIRLESLDLGQLEQDLCGLVANPDAAVSSRVAAYALASTGNSNTSLHQAAIVGKTPSEISQAAQALIDGPIRHRHTSALAKECAWLRVGTSSGSANSIANRIAWLFPGQGSQYRATPALLDDRNDAAVASRANEFLRDIDIRLQRRSLEPVRSRIDDPKRQLGRDVWWTQLWVLAVGATMTNAMRSRGHRPDVVLGHSFGECTAAWAAGVMDMDQAIEFAKCRSDAVIMTRQVGGELLSVRGEPSAVQSVIDQDKLAAVISHHNSPLNTVIAGSRDEIAKAKDCLHQAGLASVVINVPAAFHTPQMKPAQDLLRARYGGQHLRPPNCGFLSAVSNRYLAEPIDLMNNLIDQLTQPVCFNGALQRIVQEGCGLLIEVGPENVLTRLARATVDGRAICLSADDRNRDYHAQQTLIDLACEAFSGNGVGTFNGNSRATNATLGSLNSQSRVETNGVAKPPVDRFEIVDLTRGRRRSIESADPSNGRSPMPRKTGSRSGIGQSGPTLFDSSVSAAESLSRLAKSNPTVSSSSSSPAAVAVSNSVDMASARSFLFDLVVDLTGYDPEIIEFDADLEAELGVDSIKKAQLIGEIVQWSGVPIETQSMQLAQFETLNDILGILSSGTSKSGSEVTVATLPIETAPDDPSTSDQQYDSLHRLIIDLVVDQTGYHESIIDMDADMEGELGIDSIKKAQLLGELEQQYQLQSIRETNLTLADFSTLGSIRDFVWQQIATVSETDVSGDAAELLQKKNESEPHLISVVPSSGTHRFALRTHWAPRCDDMPLEPIWRGSALVVGNNAIADAIVQRWRRDPETAIHPIHHMDASMNAEELETKLDQVWHDGVSNHLFLTTPQDVDAIWATHDSAAWQRRRQAALMNPFRICQRWMQSQIDTGNMHQSSLVTVVRGGGSFGLEAGSCTDDACSAESGGLAGLTKAMLIEAWMRGHRDTPMLVIDPRSAASPGEVVDGVWRELAAPSYDEEVIVAGADRLATTAAYCPIDPSSLDQIAVDASSNITRGGAWIIAGGGRGITALTAMELASRHGLKLHLLGTAPVPQIDDQIRRRAAADRGELRRRVMTQVQSKGGNPVTTWQKLEKAIEIDQTLQACRERSIEATYHRVDVSDAQAVKACLQNIRQTDGPIHGVIQGAGAGQDSRFDRKRADKVEKCFRAKIDGCISLADATRDDPLEWFIGFGSISGRFGANGHTDYSAANDMLAKLITNLKYQRPQTRCVTFHWHAWGDIGMATKPEAKLALDMIGMEFMPAQEGLQHFLREVEHGGDLTEVLITDRRYVRKFFPDGEAISTNDDAAATLPLLDPENRGLNGTQGHESSYAVTFNPTTDRFLSEHLVHGRPTLPFVVAIELLAESARASHFEKTGKPLYATACRHVQAHQPLKCLTEDSFAIELQQNERDPDRWSLVSDLRRRDGRLVQAARPHFTATIELNVQLETIRWTAEELLEHRTVDRRPVVYQPSEAPVYHGPQLQCLREIGFEIERNSVGPQSSLAVGVIVAPSPAHLAGEHRPLRGWSISPASLDAVLYAAGMLAYRVSGRASLPISFNHVQIGRLPRPGEVLRVIVQMEQETDRGATLNAMLAGQNRDCIIRLDGYQIGWLG